MTIAENGTISLDRAIPSQEPSGIVGETMEVCSRGRVYLDQDQRARIGIEGNPYGAELAVLARTPLEFIDPTTPNGQKAAGTHAATARVRCQERGEFVLPASVRGFLDIDIGDTVVLSIQPVPTD